MKKITIGRAPDNDIIFNVQTISNYHADVMYSDGRVIFTDHSTNGSWINGRKLHNNSIEIRQDDVIILPGNVFLDWQSLVKASKNTQFWDPGYAGSEPKNYHNDNPYNTMNYQNYDNPQPESRDYIVNLNSATL